MPIPIAEQILGVVKEGLGLWKTFISTRQEAFNRQQDKKQAAAIEAAEKFIFEVDKVLVRVEDEYPDIVKEKEVKAGLKLMAHFRKRFFHYN